jgi:ATP-dependent helicase/DNAse subunit B
MPVHFHETPTIRAALDHAVRDGLASRGDDLLAPITFLLPRREDAGLVRRALGAALGVSVMDFYGLGEAILAGARSPVRRLKDLAIRRLVRQCLDDMEAGGELTTFAGMLDKPGFIGLLVQWLREMKAQGIDPDTVAKDAARSGRRRDHQLAGLYRRYQEFLVENHYSDGDGLLWLAAGALEEESALPDRLGRLYVIGFDLFSPIQQRLMNALARRIDHLAFYLLWDAHRPETNVALSRLRQTRDWIRRELETVVAQPLPAGPDPITPLRRHLFRLEAPPAAGLADRAVVRAIAAPSREAEVRLALRAVKQQLAGGVAPEAVAILAPRPGVYARLVQTVADEYDLPVQLELKLERYPAVGALVNLLQLEPEFRWRPTFDALRSNYLSQPWLDPEQIELLDLLTRQRPVVGGRDQWLFALQPLRPDRPAADDEALDDQPLVARLAPETLRAIQNGLTRFFDHLTPAESGTFREYTCWLQDHILAPFPGEESPGEEGAVAGLGLVSNCLSDLSGEEEPDVQAMAKVMGILRDLLQAAELVGGDTAVPWTQYRDELLTGLSGESYRSEQVRGAVRFAALEAGRALSVDYLYVLGLGEGELPTAPPPDALYGLAERRSHALPLQKPVPSEDASIWWQVVSNCHRQLVLLRPRLDDNGAPWEPSPYYQAVMACADVLEERPPLIQLPPPEEAAGKAETLAALAGQSARQAPPALEKPWLAALRAAHVMALRQGWPAPAEFEGVFRDPALVAELAGLYGPRRAWSASRLNRYGNCPYGFFAQQILGLEARPDPGEGFDAAQRGSLMHAVLEVLYRRLNEEDLLPSEPNQEAVLARLEQVCDRLLSTAPQRYGFRPGPLWRYEQREMRRQLRALLRWECRENGPQATYRPTYLELHFGLGAGGPPPLELSVDDVDFRLHGIIDRLDLDQNGRARLIDYKSGAMGYSKPDIQKGLAFQTALYALAAETLLDEVIQVRESAYWHIPSRKASGRLLMDGGAGQDEFVREVVERAAVFVSRVRHGIFPSAPGKGSIPCYGGCDLAGICRVSRLSIYKARQVYE